MSDKVGKGDKSIEDKLIDLMHYADEMGLGVAMVSEDTGDVKMIMLGESDYIDEVSETWGILLSSHKKNLQ